MKLTEHNQLGIAFTAIPFYRNETVKRHRAVALDLIEDEGTRHDAYERFFGLLDERNNQFYYLSSKAKAITEKIKIDSKLQPDFLNGITIGKKVTILLGNEFFRYHVLKGCIMCIRGRETPAPAPYFTYTCFSIYTDERNQFNYPDNYMDPLADESFVKFLRLLIFLELSDTELRLLKRGDKAGDKRIGKTLNASPNEIVYVDSLWNITSVFMGKFVVAGHLRLQRVGEGRKESKLIYIEPFTKDGYTRQARSDKNK